MKRTDYQLFYDHAMLPAIKNHIGKESWKEFPATYTIHEGNSINSNGLYSFISRTIPSEYLKPILKTLRTLIEKSPALSQFKGFFYGVHAKDLKLTLRSTFNDPLEEFFCKNPYFEWEKIPIHDIYFDVGMEIFSVGPNTLLFRAEFVKKYLKHIGMGHIQIRDWCLTNIVAGGDGQGNITGKNPAIRHCQLYMCEKNVLYKYGGGGVQSFSIQHICNNAKRYQYCIGNMKAAWSENAAGSFGARMEWRIRGSRTTKLITQLNLKMPGFLDQKMLYVVPTKIVTQFKTELLRVFAETNFEIMNWSKICSMKRQLLHCFFFFQIKALVSSPDYRNGREV